MNTTRDTDDAVRARMKRQEWLHVPGKELHQLVGETHAASAVYGAEARRIVTRVRRDLAV
ncbi:hypothetical protein AB0M61_26730 [Streptomyces sp. NPDC051642]|uniref:hypothetical protein n=1 Tax=Streptomyces sp. NPDC051642 TaxID=3154646 RepID=UPI00342664C2